MESRFFLNVVVGEGTAILELLASEDKTLLVGGDAFLVLDLLFHGLDGVRRLDLKGDSLSSQSLNEDLHTTTETKDQVEGRFFLDVVVREGAAIFELFASEDKTLLVRGNSLLVLDLLLHGLDRVRGLDFEGDSLPGEGLDENLHTTAKTKDQVEGRFFLDVVVREGAAIFELLSGKDKTLLVRGNAFLVLDLLFHSLDGVRGLDLEGDSLPGEGLDKDLHGCCCWSVGKKGKVVVVGKRGILVLKQVARRWCKLIVFVERGNLSHLFTETHFFDFCLYGFLIHLFGRVFFGQGVRFIKNEESLPTFLQRKEEVNPPQPTTNSPPTPIPLQHPPQTPPPPR